MHTVVPPLVHFKIFTHQNVTPNHPILIETISFHKNKHFFIFKTSFSMFEFVCQNQRGYHMHTVVPPLVHFKIFTHQNVAPNHPILIETISFHKNKHFFIFKTSFSMFEFCCQNQRGYHMHTVVPPLVHFKIFTHQNVAPNHPILIETISFHKKQAFFHFQNKCFNF